MNLNLLKKIAVWGLAFCAVAISPVILVYGVLFGIGIVSDLAQIVADQALFCVVSAVWVGWVWYTLAISKMPAVQFLLALAGWEGEPLRCSEVRERAARPSRREPSRGPKTG